LNDWPNATYSPDAQTGVFVRPQVEAFGYSDGDEVEQRIAAAIRDAKDLSTFSLDLEAHCVDWPSRYHLSGVRSNLLRPYEHLLRGDILEIGAGCGAITRYLGEAGARVTALEGSYRRASIAASRNRDAANVKVVCDNFLSFVDDRKFDVVTLIGVLEYARMFDAADDAVEKLLSRARAFLKPGGLLVLAIENKLGLKYFAGMPEDHVNHGMYGIESLYRPREPVTFGRHELNQLLASTGFAKTAFAYPFPDYKLPVSVVLPAAMDEDPAVFNAASFAAESVTLDAQLGLPALISLELGWQSIGSNKLLGELANSFLVLAAPALDTVFEDAQILVRHYGVPRNRRYAKETVFRREGSKISVEKRWLHGEVKAGYEIGPSLAHTSTNDAYVAGVSYQTEFSRILARPSWSAEDVVAYFRRYVYFLLAEFAKDGGSEQPLDPAIALNSVALDILPHNIIVSNGAFHAIDIEWRSNEKIELGSVLFRALLYLLNSLTRCGYPDDFTMATRGHFVRRVYEGLFGTSEPLDCERWWADEARFQYTVTGNVEKRSYGDWCIGPLPILDSSTRSIGEVLVEIQRLRSEQQAVVASVGELGERLNYVQEALSCEFDEDISGTEFDEPLEQRESPYQSAALRENLDRLTARIVLLSTTSDAFVNQLRKSRANETSLNQDLDSLRVGLDSSQIEGELLRVDLDSSREKNELLARELERMRASYSWKLTRPLRALRRLAQR